VPVRYLRLAEGQACEFPGGSATADQVETGAWSSRGSAAVGSGSASVTSPTPLGSSPGARGCGVAWHGYWSISIRLCPASWTVLNRCYVCSGMPKASLSTRMATRRSDLRTAPRLAS
jgi:hypothetical protein